jgi:Stage II sporulation protein E (SpoIIE)
VVLQLQRAILPLHDEPFDLPGLRTVVRYLPASRASQLGGDWYITAEMPDDKVLLAIGDVGGHGLAAAAGMARLRGALAGLAITGAAPEQLIGWLNDLVWHVDPEHIMATCCCCTATAWSSDGTSPLTRAWIGWYARSEASVTRNGSSPLPWMLCNRRTPTTTRAWSHWQSSKGPSVGASCPCKVDVISVAELAASHLSTSSARRSRSLRAQRGGMMCRWPKVAHVAMVTGSRPLRPWVSQSVKARATVQPFAADR